MTYQSKIDKFIVPEKAQIKSKAPEEAHIEQETSEDIRIEQVAPKEA